MFLQPSLFGLDFTLQLLFGYEVVDEECQAHGHHDSAAEEPVLTVAEECQSAKMRDKDGKR